MAISSMTSNINVVNPDMRTNSLNPVRYGVASPMAPAVAFTVSGSPSDLEDDATLLSLTMSAESTVATAVSLDVVIFLQAGDQGPDAFSSNRRLG